MRQKILAIGAHPDDIEFGCGGVLLKEKLKGNKIMEVVLSLGEAGTAGTAAQRKQESQKAAKMLGAEIEFLNMGGDCHVEYLPKHSIRLAQIIRKFRPDIVLAPSLHENQHPDHSVAGKLSRDAARFARYGGLKELKNLKPHRIQALYYYPVTRDFGEDYNIIIDVTAVMPEWEKLMKLHHSQVTSKEYIALQTAKARLLGLAVGTKFALGLFANDPVHLGAMSDIQLSSRNF